MSDSRELSTTLADAGRSAAEKMVDKLRETAKQEFMNSLSDEQYRELARQTIDEFLNGPFNRRNHVTRARIHVSGANELKANQKFIDPPKYIPGTYYYTVETVERNEKYSPMADPDTLPGQIVAWIKEDVNKNMFDEIMRNPEMRKDSVGNNQQQFFVFKEFVSKFLLDNWQAIMMAEYQMRMAMVMDNVSRELGKVGSLNAYR